MNIKERFILTIRLAVLALGIFIIAAIALYAYLLPPEEHQFFIEFVNRHFGILVIPPLLLLLILGAAVHWFADRYLAPLNQISEETNMLIVNPSHRLKMPKSETLRRLASAINAAADHFEAIRKSTTEQISEARQKLEAERNILMTLIHRLDDGFLVCNRDFNILLYNQKAESFYSNVDATDLENRHYIGLGRSLMNLLDPQIIQHAVDELKLKSIGNDRLPVSRFITLGANGTLLQFSMSPIPDKYDDIEGYLLIIRDITQSLSGGTSRLQLLESYHQKLRSGVAGIRAAAESLVHQQNIGDEQMKNFLYAILEESNKLGSIIKKTEEKLYKELTEELPLEQIQLRDLAEAIANYVAKKQHIQLQTIIEDDVSWVKADSFSIIKAFEKTVVTVRKIFNNPSLTLRTSQQNRLAFIEIFWKPGKPSQPQIETFRHEIMNDLEWEIIQKRHHAELWDKFDLASNTMYCRLVLPVVETPLTNLSPPIEREHRPEFFDFDLFAKRQINEELENTPLSELIYTVFDTETTGLNPSEGDEIISIGAVRIVNGRILRREIFDQLVKPSRPVPKQSTQIHGITPEMLAEQPDITKVLPKFQEFARDTVLVAHNAAFDMRFINIQAKKMGLSFDNPVLDTLLLSAYLHKNQNSHSLDEIARRLGVSIIGRHTALGDALATAAIFLKLIPLLQQQGIVTLGDALTASQNTFYARLKY
jgi:DNA polymerase-3 subunit epsilon